MRYCLTRGDVALVAGQRGLTPLQGHQANGTEGPFGGYKGDQAQQGSVIVRTRLDAFGARSGIGAARGTVALKVELLSGYPTLPERASASLYLYRNEVRVRGYTQALGALRETVVEAGGYSREVGFHSLRIAASTTLAAWGGSTAECGPKRR